MTYPNQPAGYPQNPAQPQYPQQYPPQFAPQGQPYQPQWGQPQPQVTSPAPQLARGSLEDFIDQPTGGGGAATSKFFTPQRPVGSWLQLRVTRDLNASDVKQQTDKFGTPLTFKSSGKPKWVLIIPCQVLSSSDGSHQTIYPDGQVTVWLKGVPSDAFKTAMSAGGVSDPARALALGKLANAEFYMIGAGTKQFGNGNPANMFDFQYTSNGRELLEATIDKAITAPAQPDMTQQYQQQAPPTAPQFASPTAPVAAAPPAPVPSFTPAPGTVPGNPVQQAGPFAQPAFQPPIPGSGMPPVPPAGLPPVPQPGVTPPPAPAQPFNGQVAQAPQLDAEKAALLARLQGQG